MRFLLLDSPSSPFSRLMLLECVGLVDAPFCLFFVEDGCGADNGVLCEELPTKWLFGGGMFGWLGICCGKGKLVGFCIKFT